MSKCKAIVICILLAGLPLVSPAVLAEEVKASGKNMFVPTIHESFELPDGTTANRMTWNGFMTTADPGSPLSLASMTCSGVAVMHEDGAQVRSAGSCDSVDADGDVAFYWWRHDEKGGHWGFLGGTGKWTGVEGGGTYEPAYEWKDGRTGNDWKGTWTTK